MKFLHILFSFAFITLTLHQPCHGAAILRQKNKETAMDKTIAAQFNAQMKVESSNVEAIVDPVALAIPVKELCILINQYCWKPSDFFAALYSMSLLKGHTDELYSIAIDKQGTIITGSADCTAKVWDITGKCIRTLIGHNKAVSAVAIGGPNETVITGSLDQTVRSWNKKNESTVITTHDGFVRNVAIDDTGVIFSRSDDDVLQRNDTTHNDRKKELSDCRAFALGNNNTIALAKHRHVQLQDTRILGLYSFEIDEFKQKNDSSIKEIETHAPINWDCFSKLRPAKNVKSIALGHSRIYTINEDDVLCIWDYDKTLISQKTLPPSFGSTTCIYGADGTIGLYSRRDNNIKLLDDDGSPFFIIVPRNILNNFVMSDDGTIAYYCMCNNSATVWRPNQQMFKALLNFNSTLLLKIQMLLQSIQEQRAKKHMNEELVLKVDDVDFIKTLPQPIRDAIVKYFEYILR